jgi:hypothetical protein
VFNIFVLRNFIEDLPKDLFEAAEMDGASHFQQIRNIVIPMSAPIIGTLSILAFLAKWNDFLLPLIVLRDKELFTLGVGLIYLDGEYVKQWGQIMAAYFLASLPADHHLPLHHAPVCPRPMAHVTIENLSRSTRKKAAPASKWCMGSTWRSATASSWCWSARPAAANPPPCA